MSERKEVARLLDPIFVILASLELGSVGLHHCVNHVLLVNVSDIVIVEIS